MDFDIKVIIDMELTRPEGQVAKIGLNGPHGQ